MAEFGREVRAYVRVRSRPLWRVRSIESVLVLVLVGETAQTVVRRVGESGERRLDGRCCADHHQPRLLPRRRCVGAAAYGVSAVAVPVSSGPSAGRDVAWPAHTTVDPMVA